MSTRLQVLFPDDELDEIRRMARSQRMTLSEWVRQALREAQRRPSERSVEEKLAAIDRAAAHGFPTADIDQMLAEIERAYVARKG